jgi:hypothetical protein
VRRRRDPEAHYHFGTGNLYDQGCNFISGSHPEQASQPLQEAAPAQEQSQQQPARGWDTTLDAYYEFSTGNLYNRDGSLIPSSSITPAASEYHFADQDPGGNAGELDPPCRVIARSNWSKPRVKGPVSRAFTRSRRADSNRGPLHYE